MHGLKGVLGQYITLVLGLVDPGEDSRIGAKGVTGNQLIADPTRIYRGWFGPKGSHDAKLVVLSPRKDTEDPPTQADGEESSQTSLEVRRDRGPGETAIAPGRRLVSLPEESGIANE